MMRKIILESYIGKRLWQYFRLKKILRNQKNVSVSLLAIIESYINNEEKRYRFSPKKQFTNSKIIWQYWGQGFNNLPEVVKMCFESVERHKGEYTIIRLDDTTIQEYVDIPDFIWNKFEEGIINKTFFSDILRLVLLYNYGGVWLDSTIFLSGPLEQKYIDEDYFMFQRSVANPYKKVWESSYAYYWGWDQNFKVTVLNSIIYAKKGNKVIYDLLMLLVLYWEKYDKALDYFIFQIFYHEFINIYQSDFKCIIVDDTFPHILQTLFNNNAKDLYEIDSTLKLTTTHKMSYFDNEGLSNFMKFVNSYGY